MRDAACTPASRAPNPNAAYLQRHTAALAALDARTAQGIHPAMVARPDGSLWHCESMEEAARAWVAA